MEYQGINGKANAGLVTGIIGTAGTALGLMGNNGLFGNNVEGKQYVTKDELDYVQTISAKDSEIALLKSEQNTEVKIADVYERIMTRVNADQRNQADWNAAQAVFNATNTASIGCIQNQIAQLQGMTKLYIPAANVTPEPMPLLNKWVAPTS